MEAQPLCGLVSGVTFPHRAVLGGLQAIPGSSQHSEGGVCTGTGCHRGLLTVDPGSAERLLTWSCCTPAHQNRICHEREGSVRASLPAFPQKSQLLSPHPVVML